jgi:hypothetical protein
MKSIKGELDILNLYLNWKADIKVNINNSFAVYYFKNFNVIEDEGNEDLIFSDKHDPETIITINTEDVLCVEQDIDTIIINLQNGSIVITFDADKSLCFKCKSTLPDYCIRLINQLSHIVNVQ